MNSLEKRTIIALHEDNCSLPVKQDVNQQKELKILAANNISDDSATIVDCIVNTCTIDQFREKKDAIISILTASTDLTKVSIDNLTANLLKNIEVSGNFRNKTDQLNTLHSILLGIVANELKNKVTAAKEENWTTFSKRHFGHICKPSALQQHMRVARIADAHEYDVFGIKLLDALGKAIQKDDCANINTIESFLDSKNISSNFDPSDINAIKGKRGEIKDVLKPPEPDQTKKISRKIRAAKNSLLPLSQLSESDIKLAKKEEVVALKTLARNLSENLTKIYPSETQFELPFFNKPNNSEG